MNTPGRVRRGLVAVMIGVLVGGGLLAVTPAGAEVAQLAATNWKKIWKQELQPQADKRYYKKSKADKKFAAKADTYTKAEVWTRTESDTRYQAKGNYATAGSSYTKAESDAKYAPYPTVIRGAFAIIGPAPAANQEMSQGISFGVQFSAAPTPHYIAAGDAPPAGCSGTPAAPNADPGHLCVFENTGTNISQRGVFGHAGLLGQTSLFGANLYIRAAAAGTAYSYGSWAARPSGSVTAARPVPDARTPEIGR